jgi:hypothetical protein
MLRSAIGLLGVLLLAGSWSGPASAQMQKSAQGDCQKEAVRRGYQVLYTGNFQQHRDGWTMDIRVRDANGRTEAGTCFVETRTGEASLYGIGWSGGGSSGGSPTEFSCGSNDERYRECQLPVDGRARLVKQRSDAPCIKGSTWGQKGDRVWVDRGCRARFVVETGGPGWGGGGQGQSHQAEAACRSEALRQGMRVERVSGAEWTPSGRYWLATVRGEYRGERLNAGCRWHPERNRTELNFGGGWGQGGGGGSGASAAEQACAREAQGQGYRIVARERPFPTQQGYSMQMKLRRSGGATRDALCRYHRGSGRAQIEVYGAGRSAPE